MLTEWQKRELSGGFNVYCIFMAIKLHFNDEKFDYSVYGPMNYKFETFVNKKGVPQQFAKLARKFETSQSEVVENYIIANFIVNPKTWVSYLLTRQAKENYDQFRILYDNFAYNFIDMTEKLMIPRLREESLTFMQYVKGDGESHPLLLTDIMTKKYPIWYVIGLNKIMGLFEFYDKILAEDIFWGSESFLLKKINAVVVDQESDYTKLKFRETLKSHGVA